MPGEPLRGQLGDRFQGAGFLEEMSGAGDDGQPMLTAPGAPRPAG